MMAKATQGFISSTLPIFISTNSLRARLEDLVLPTLDTDVVNTAYGGCLELGSMEQDTSPLNRQQGHRRRGRLLNRSLHPIDDSSAMYHPSGVQDA